jgi:hypothetical protein
VFAARALKSAIFGTPAPPVDDTRLEMKTETEGMADRDIKSAQSYSMSPTKPQGILLTPGTATTRRKTVSFGAELSDKADKRENKELTAMTHRDPVQKERPSNKIQRKTPLTKSLELVRETKAGKRDPERRRGTSRPQPLIDLDRNKNGIGETAGARPNSADSSTSQTSNQDLLLQLVAGAEPDGDVTMDLNEPHSQSGQYWKFEYDRYHGEAKAEMEKLLKYKQLAKSYAKKKDAETLVLTEKLKDEQRRIVSLEDTISKLSAKLDTIGIQENSDGSHDLVKELAIQTALARRYKAQADELRAAGDKKTEARIARDHLGDRSHASLSPEMKDLRKQLSVEQETSSRLLQENAKLKQELLDANLRLEEQESRSERGRQAAEEQLQKKSETCKSLQRDYDSLKEKAKAQRGSAEHLLKKNHDQIAALRKEVASLKRLQVLGNAYHKEAQQSRPEDKVVVSPIKADAALPGTSRKLPSQSPDISLVEDREVLVASNRLPSLLSTKTRTELPPERVAAALARLQKKNAEKKKKTLELSWNKENVDH